MTQEEYIEEHPWEFRDNLDKWLFKEFGITGGCCASQLQAQYYTARQVGEKLQQAIIDKACEWLEENIYNYVYENRDFNESAIRNNLFEEFRKAMEE